MWEKCKRKGKRLTPWALGMAVMLLLFGGKEMAVRAADSNFVIEAGILPANEETYDIQLNIENLGADWEGTVRVIVDEEYRCPAAYDTVISLPQGSEKQFVVKVPVDSIEDTDGTIWVSLWDKKGEKAAGKEFKRFLLGDAEALSMGILSDEYSTLTYLDMGGEELYFYGDEYPFSLQELEQGSIADMLDALDFLVIDTYNTSILTDEELQAIELWIHAGGVLIVGTGSHAEDTLAGFRDSYLGIDCGQVYDAGEISSHMYSDYVDLTQIALAELRDLNGQYEMQYCSSAMACSIGDGAIGVLPYSLTDVADMGDDFYQGVKQEYFVMNILEEISNYANVRYSSAYYYGESIDMLRRMLNIIGKSNSPLNFGVLKFIVILYVIFVGPILYLILRFMKKRELYWVTVPVTALLGILLVFLAGRGFEVVDTRVYSVTVEDLSGKQDGKTYLYCYDAKHDEWDLKLKNGYDYIGALMNDHYYYIEDEDVYYHHMKKEGDTLSFGVRPSSNFEDSYFYAGKNAADGTVSGSIVSNDVMCDWAGISGTITNDTNYDFPYYAVITNDTLYVYEGLAAGTTCNLAEAMPIYSTSQSYGIWNNYVYDFLYDVHENEQAEKVSALSALGVGICSAYPQNDVASTVVVGVIADWDKAVDDACSEISYGCLYSVQ